MVATGSTRIGLDREDPLWILNEYRAAEIHGAGAIMRMGRLADSSSLSTDLSRHMRDEAIHSWLWTKMIRDLGGEIVEVDQPYQARLGLHFGLPRSLTELLALTWVSERRGVTQYTEHLDSGGVSTKIQQTLRAILKDERWHVSYISEDLQRRVRSDPAVQEILDRALAADERAIADLASAPAGEAGHGAWPTTG